jgi:hypothetical protein
MPVRYQKFITRRDIQANRNSLYVFGDNLTRTGFGGQAKHMRGEGNSIGVATKVLPTYDANAFMCDAHSPEVLSDIKRVEEEFYDGGYEYLVIPEDGIGTGLSRLNETAPNLFGIIEYTLFTHWPRKYGIYPSQYNLDLYRDI